MVDMPEGTALEETARVTRALAAQVIQDPDVVNVQTYVGTSAPYNFNGLVRHYFLRRAPQPRRPAGEPRGRKTSASEQSHAIARRVRDRAAAGGAAAAARRFRSPKCRPGRRCYRRWSPRCTDPTTNAGSSVAREVRRVIRGDAGRGRRGLVRRGRTAEVAARGRRARRRPPPGCRRPRSRTVVRMAGAGEAVGLLHDRDGTRGRADRASARPRRAGVRWTPCVPCGSKGARPWPSAS